MELRALNSEHTGRRVGGLGGAGRVGAAVRGQAQGPLERLVAPVQLLHLSPMQRPRPVQLLQQVLVGADQGAAGTQGRKSRLLTCGCARQQHPPS